MRYFALMLFTVAGMATAETATDRKPPPPDSSVSVGLTYESAFTGYRPYQQQAPAVWKQVNEEVTGQPAAAGHAGIAMPPKTVGMTGDHAGHGGMAMQKDSAMKPAAGSGAVDKTMEPTAASGAGASVARAVVQSVNRADARVKLKHGPIGKLGMPGMTMMFRVTDPKLLDKVQEGDEIGFTVEKIDNAFVVTDIQK